MKWLTRFASLILCMMLMMNVAFSESLEDDYTQSEKMQRQYELGSGLIGAMKFAVAGQSGLAQLLAPLNDTEIQARSILSGNEMSTQFYAVKNGTETAQTEIYRNADSWFVKTSLLLGSTLSLTDKGDLLSTLTSSETNGNPSLYSFMLHFLSADTSLWKGMSIESAVNSWLENYVQNPMVIQEDNETRMRFQYIIPSADLLNGIKVALHNILGDAAARKKITTLMTAEQAEVLLNPDLEWYLDSVIEKIPLSGTAVFERTVTMQGTEVSSHIQLPVYEPKGIWNLLEISTVMERTVYTLSGEHMTLSWEPESENRGVVSYKTENNPSISVLYDLSSKFETSTDAEDYHHETTTYILKLTEKETEDASVEWLNFDPVEIQMRLHYYSKSAKRSATTLEITLAGIIPGGRIQAAAKFRTTTPWDISKMDIDNSISIDGKTSEERLEIGQDILANLLMSLEKLEPQAVEETATAADIEENEAPSEPIEDGEEGADDATAAEPDTEMVTTENAESSEDIPDAENEDLAEDTEDGSSESEDGTSADDSEGTNETGDGE